MKEETNLKSQHVWESFQSVWVIYGWIYVAGVVVLFWIQPPHEPKVILLFATWCVWLAGLRFWEHTPRDSLGLGLVGYMLVGVGLWLALSWQKELFFSLMGVMFPAIFRLLTIKRASLVVSILAIGWAVIASERYKVPAFEAYLVAAFGYASALTIGWFIYRIVGQSLSRQELLTQLSETQAALVASERKAGGLEERRRLAGELHDTLAQNFTSVITHLEAAEAALDRSSSDLRGYLQTAKRVAKEGLEQTRNRVWTMRPDIEQHMPLEASLRRIGEAWTQENGIALECHITGKPYRVTAEFEDLFRRCVRECLLNILKHARATRVDVTLSYMDHLVALDVVDNGIGYDVSLPASGYGLAAMAHAVQAAGGDWAVESAPGDGVVIAVKIPIGPEGSAE